MRTKKVCGVRILKKRGHMFHWDRKEEEQRKCTEKENQLILAPAFIGYLQLLESNLCYKNTGTFLQGCQVGGYEWVNAVISHTWKWTDG